VSRRGRRCPTHTSQGRPISSHTKLSPRLCSKWHTTITLPYFLYAWTPRWPSITQQHWNQYGSCVRIGKSYYIAVCSVYILRAPVGLPRFPPAHNPQCDSFNPWTLLWPLPVVFSKVLKVLRYPISYQRRHWPVNESIWLMPEKAANIVCSWDGTKD